MEMKIGDFNCYLTHIPIDPNIIYKKNKQPDFNIVNLYDFIICGHVHEKWLVNNKHINVGIDIWKNLIDFDVLLSFINKVKKENIIYL